MPMGNFCFLIILPFVILFMYSDHIGTVINRDWEEQIEKAADKHG